MSQIENVYQLRAEIARLKAEAANHEAGLRKNLTETAKSLAPGNIFWTIVSAVTGIKVKGDEILSRGVKQALNYIFQRYIVKAERKAEDKIYSTIDTVFTRVRDFVNKHTHSEARRAERETTGEM